MYLYRYFIVVLYKLWVWNTALLCQDLSVNLPWLDKLFYWIQNHFLRDYDITLVVKPAASCCCFYDYFDRYVNPLGHFARAFYFPRIISSRTLRNRAASISTFHSFEFKKSTFFIFHPRLDVIVGVGINVGGGDVAVVVIVVDVNDVAGRHLLAASKQTSLNKRISVSLKSVLRHFKCKNFYRL